MLGLTLNRLLRAEHARNSARPLKHDRKYVVHSHVRLYPMLAQNIQINSISAICHQMVRSKLFNLHFLQKSVHFVRYHNIVE